MNKLKSFNLNAILNYPIENQSILTIFKDYSDTQVLIEKYSAFNQMKSSYPTNYKDQILSETKIDDLQFETLYEKYKDFMEKNKAMVEEKLRMLIRR